MAGFVGEGVLEDICERRVSAHSYNAREPLVWLWPLSTQLPTKIPLGSLLCTISHAKAVLRTNSIRSFTLTLPALIHSHDSRSNQLHLLTSNLFSNWMQQLSDCFLSHLANIMTLRVPSIHLKCHVASPILFVWIEDRVLFALWLECCEAFDSRWRLLTSRWRVTRPLTISVRSGFSKH